MAGEMKGHKAMSKGKGKMPVARGPKPPRKPEGDGKMGIAKAPPPPSPTGGKGGSPKSAHIREAEGGYIISKHGGDNDSFGKDHVAADFDAAMAMCREHLGGAAPKPVVEATAPGPGDTKVRKDSGTEA